MNLVKILTSQAILEDLNVFKGNPFESMIKYVVDIDKKILALGGEMHSDSEQVLIESGSKQENLWGANIYPWSDPIEIEYISLINIRPSAGNLSMEIQDEGIRDLVKSITFDWIKLK